MSRPLYRECDRCEYLSTGERAMADECHECGHSGFNGDSRKGLWGHMYWFPDGCLVVGPYEVPA